MKKYILVLFSGDARKVYRQIESMLKTGDKYNTMKIKTFHVVTFVTDVPLAEIKKTIEDSESPAPLFIIFDATNRGNNFEVCFGQLEPTLLLESTTIFKEAVDMNKVIKDEYDLNELLELVFKNGYESLTEKQRDILKRYSDGEEEK